MKLRPGPAHRRRQHGISLIVSLILMAVAAMVALGSMRAVQLQTRMSGAAHDRSLAFQAAEAALREAEQRALAAQPTDFPSSDCISGFCAQALLTDNPRWLDDAFAGWRTATAAAPADAPVPEAIVEDQGDGPNWMGCANEIPRQTNCLTRRYLITSRSTADGRATVLVQSQFAAP